jgi:hypothetical protein
MWSILCKSRTELDRGIHPEDAIHSIDNMLEQGQQLTEDEAVGLQASGLLVAGFRPEVEQSGMHLSS